MIYALAMMMFQILSLFHRLLGSWALSIVAFTVLVRILLHPMTYQQQRFSKKMQKMQPEIEKLTPLKKKDINEYNKALMELYQKHGVNPAAGCLPMFIQLPVMFALFAMLRNPVINQGLLAKEKFFGMPMDAVVFQTTTDLPLPTEYVDFVRASQQEPAQYRLRAGFSPEGDPSEVATGFTDPSSPPYRARPQPDFHRHFDNPLYATVSQGSFPDKVVISYPPYPFAKSYRIKKYIDPDTVEELALPGFRKTSFEDQNVKPGAVYAYEIIAELPTGEQVSSGLLFGYVGMNQAWGVRASQGTYSDAIEIKWNKPAGSDRVIVERKLSGEPEFKAIATLKPQLPSTYILRKGKKEAPVWHLIYLPALLLVALYALGQWLYQKDFTKHFSSPESTKYFNPNLMLGIFLLFSIFFPVGLILYFITYLISGMIENRIVLKRLALEEHRAIIQEAGGV